MAEIGTPRFPLADSILRILPAVKPVGKDSERQSGQKQERRPKKDEPQHKKPEGDEGHQIDILA